MARAANRVTKRGSTARAGKATARSTSRSPAAKSARAPAKRTAARSRGAAGDAATRSRGSQAKKTATKPATKTATKTKTTKAGSTLTRAPTSSKRAASRVRGGARFAEEQRRRLLDERNNYLRQAEELKAEADALALEHEPGDVQFDEEGGEGGTANVDRELDLVLSAQARTAIAEIDRALTKLEDGTYGRCEQCGADIPQDRLRALPQATLCVRCKSGGLASRR